MRFPELRAVEGLQPRPQERREHRVEAEPLPGQVDLVDEQVVSDHAAEEPAGVILAADGLA